MDSVHIAVAGIALLAAGLIGFFAVTLFFMGLAVRYAVLPRLRPLATRLVGDAKTWVMPPQQPRVALSRATVRPSPRR